MTSNLSVDGFDLGLKVSNLLKLPNTFLKNFKYSEILATKWVETYIVAEAGP